MSGEGPNITFFRPHFSNELAPPAALRTSQALNIGAHVTLYHKPYFLLTNLIHSFVSSFKKLNSAVAASAPAALLDFSLFDEIFGIHHQH